MALPPFQIYHNIGYGALPSSLGVRGTFLGLVVVPVSYFLGSTFEDFVSDSTCPRVTIPSLVRSVVEALGVELLGFHFVHLLYIRKEGRYVDHTIRSIVLS